MEKSKNYLPVLIALNDMVIMKNRNNMIIGTFGLNFDNDVKKAFRAIRS